MTPPVIDMPRSPAELSLDAVDLHVALDSDAGVVRAVDGVSLALRRGETYALVGESGCGKSVTALSLMRLLPENGRIVSGEIALTDTDASRSFDRLDLLALPEARMRAVRGGRIAIIFQEPATSLNPVMRIGDQIAETIRAHTGLTGDAVRAKTLAWLARVGLPESERRVDAYPFQLSGGQKQRVMIALALAAEPEVLIADEPTTALDVTIQAQILALLKELQAEQGMAILLITHDLGIVAQMAHRVALMYAGQIVEEAEADDFFERPLHPYARKLFDALPGSARRGQPLAAIAGTVPPLTQRFDRCRFSDRCTYANDYCRSHRPELAPASMPGAATLMVDAHPVRCFIYDPRVPPDEAPGPATESARIDADVSEVAAGPKPIVDVRDLKVYFPIRRGVLRRKVGYVKAVDGISFSIAPGRTLALVGESGCGKTTTGKALLQLLRGQAEISGEMSFEGKALDRAASKALLDARRSIQIIFQDPFASLDPRMRVADILEEGLVALRPDLSGEHRAARLLSLLEQVGLRADVMNRYPHEFSGGQRQRIAIARALAVEPKLVVCDEPTSALDVSVQAQILNLLKKLQRDLGVAYLFITHNIGVVEYLAHEVAVMYRGEIVEHGPVKSVLDEPQHEYTRSLLSAVPRVERYKQ